MITLKIMVEKGSGPFLVTMSYGDAAHVLRKLGLFAATQALYMPLKVML